MLETENKPSSQTPGSQLSQEMVHAKKDKKKKKKHHKHSKDESDMMDDEEVARLLKE